MPDPMDPSRPAGPPREVLSGNLAAVRERIAAAARRAGRDPASVTLVAVTKSVPAETIAALAALGVREFGENRPAQLLDRRRGMEAAAGGPPEPTRMPEETGLDPLLRRPLPLRWHLIGHWQTNKVRRTLPAVDLFHALDSERLAGVLSEERIRAGAPTPLPVLIEVNVSGEATKGGFRPDDLATVLPRLAALPGLRLEGLMTMAPLGSGTEGARPVFRSLREIRDASVRSGYLRGSSLSMGMSEDFESAVEEGSSIVRLGRVLFHDPCPEPSPRT